MADVLLFGATGYTGRLTAHALARRGISFSIAGRNRAKLEELAQETGDPDVHEVSAGDVEGLAAAARGTRVLLTCVGPFTKLGETAVEAALKAGVHYADSTGEGAFIERLIERYDEPARAAGIALAPALGFDEVPADLACALAADGLGKVDLTVTYDFPTAITGGTIRSIVEIAGGPARWMENGRRIDVGLGERTRWAPLPPPTGPKPTMSFPFAIGHVAPLHLDLRSFESYGVAGKVRRFAARFGTRPLLLLARTPPARAAVDKLRPSGSGPGEKGRSQRFTILAEARSGELWRNVALRGRDVYGLTAETLAVGAAGMARDSFEGVGVLAPVQTAGVETFHRELIAEGVTVDIYEPE